MVDTSGGRYQAAECETVSFGGRSNLFNHNRVLESVAVLRQRISHVGI